MNFLIGLIFIVLVTGIGLAIYGTEQMTDQYKQHCTSIGGKPLHNGKHWECLK
jgi:hypothetical protein